MSSEAPRHRIASEVAAATTDGLDRELEQRAGDRLDDEEIAALAESIEQGVERYVNQALRAAADDDEHLIH